MFDTIILLTGPVEEGPLAAALLRHNPHLAVLPAKTLDELNAIDARQLRRARLLSFATDVIVPGRILDQLGFGAYNFHPGPPSYPGWGPSHFAVYDRATAFGVTAHVMYEQVDSGPIIAVDLFGILAGISAESLEALAYARLTRQFFELAKPLSTSPQSPTPLPIQWCGRKNTRRHGVELCAIPENIAPDELERRISAFGVGRLGIAPTVRLHSRHLRHAATETAPMAHVASATADEPVAANPA